MAISPGRSLAVVTLRDRIRRWWSPAQWEDDHPAERKQRAQPKKTALGSFFSNPAKNLQNNQDDYPRGGVGIDYEHDFKRRR